MINKITFFNHFHNGDLHVSRTFVSEIINKLNISGSYSHNKNEYLLNDLNLTKDSIINIHEKIGAKNKLDSLFLNTWYGAYDQKYQNAYGITFDTLYSIFDFHLSSNFGIKLTDIHLDASKFFPKIDFSKFKIQNIDDYFNKVSFKYKILICNGEALSGQAVNFPLAQVINYLSEKYTDILFIYTNADKNIVNKSNAVSSSSIINYSLPTDLNETAYISTKCNIIVGRASGAYTFSMIQDNMFERDCTLISFSNLNNNKFWLGNDFTNILNYSAKVKNYNIDNPNEAQRILEEEIQCLK